MSESQWEYDQVVLQYNLGIISEEYKNALMEGIVIRLWNEM